MILRHLPHTQCPPAVAEHLLLNREETETIALGLVTLGPGECSKVGLHPDEEEVYLVLSGHGLLRNGDETVSVAAGDVAYIPRSHEHQMTCTSEEPLRYIYFANWPEGGAHDTLLHPSR